MAVKPLLFHRNEEISTVGKSGRQLIGGVYQHRFYK